MMMIRRAIFAILAATMIGNSMAACLSAEQQTGIY
jgi:hypothetical protein